MEQRINELTKIFNRLLRNNHFTFDMVNNNIININVYTSLFNKGLKLETLTNISNEFNDSLIEVIPYKPYVLKLIINDNRV
jgi:hypothetical protein